MVLLENLTLWDAKNTNLNGLQQLTNLRNIEIVRSKKCQTLMGYVRQTNLSQFNYILVIV